MFLDPYISFSASLLKAWQRNDHRIQAALLIAAGFVSVAIGAFSASRLSFISNPGAFQTGAAVAAVIAVVLSSLVAGSQSLLDQQQREQKIEVVEERLREHPERPQLAWDLARVKLEDYLDRNLSQVKSIYWLTLIVMICGFGFVSYGLYQASQNSDRLPVSIVASASGVLISFIGGSFLLIYRSILAQSKEYVTVLERINAVGMAVQVIASIPDVDEKLKSQTKAELAKQLLSLYAPLQASVEGRVRTKKAGRRAVKVESAAT